MMADASLEREENVPQIWIKRGGWGSEGAEIR